MDGLLRGHLPQAGSVAVCLSLLGKAHKAGYLRRDQREASH